MADIFNMTDTWNDGSTDFDAIKMAVTDTASGANSNIINCTIDGGHALKLTKNKQLLLDGGSLTNLPFSFNSDSDTGIYNSLADQLAIVTGNSLTAVFTSGNLQLRNNSGGLFFGAATDARLNYEGADHLSLRRGLNAQSFSIYETYTDGSNYSKLKISYDSGNSLFSLAGVASGTGTARRVRLVFGANWAQIESGAFSINGACRPAASSLYDLGSSSNRWRDVYLSPSSSLTPANNGDLCIEATDNTTLTFKLKGSDGTVRSGTVALS